MVEDLQLGCCILVIMLGLTIKVVPTPMLGLAVNLERLN
jgi:hypothetical protein